MTKVGDQVVECPVCAMVTTEPQCPRCAWSLRDVLMLDPFVSFESLADAQRRWNLQAAIRAAGPCKPPPQDIERFCDVAGLKDVGPNEWMNIVLPVYDRIFDSVSPTSVFRDWLAEQVRELSDHPQTSLGIIEISTDGMLSCKLTSSQWGTVRRSGAESTSWREVIPGVPSDPDKLRFFLAGGRLAGFPTGSATAKHIEAWVVQATDELGDCTQLVICNRLPGWIVTEDVVTQLGDKV